MSFSWNSSGRRALAALAFLSSLAAAPRLSLSPQTVYTVSVAQGSAGAAINVDAVNRGDGKLNPQATSSVPWLAPTIGAAHACAFFQCNTVQIALATAGLAKGIYTGVVTVSDANATDAPQTITVTVQVGGGIPDAIELFLLPGETVTRDFVAGGLPAATAVTESGGNWLSIAPNAPPAAKTNIPYTVTITAPNALAMADFRGSITLSGSTFAPDNKTIPVTLHVTTQPISRASPGALTFNIAQGAAKQTAGVIVFNGGQGSLTISGATAAASGGAWLSAATVNGGVQVTADPAGLAPGAYQGTVTVASNGANGPLTIPVTLNVEPQTAPRAFAGGVVNNGNFAGGEPLAEGDIAAVFGDQFTYGDAQQAASLPLPTTLGGAQVFLNDQPAPVYYVSPGQINFQIPFDAAPGDGVLRVDRNGQRGNNVAVNIVRSAPRALALNGGPYAIVVTPDNVLTAIPAHPARRGDTVVIYAIGLGPTAPAVASGAASPANPLAVIASTPQVCFGGSGLFSKMTCATAAFAGLTPGFVGLYQVNVVIPQDTPTGDLAPMFLLLSDTKSSVVQFSIQP